jgi:hypothetical protein
MRLEAGEDSPFYFSLADTGRLTAAESSYGLKDRFKTSNTATFKSWI